MKKRVLLYLKRNIICMKRNLLFAVAFLLVAWAATSCEALGDCGVCKYVIYENGLVQSEGPETEYCGAELIEMKTKPDLPSGTQITKVECR